MAIVTSGAHPKQYFTAVKAFFGTIYPEIGEPFNDLFNWEKSTKPYEEYVEQIGMGLAGAKGEGVTVTFDSFRQGLINRAVHMGYGLAANITREAIDDNLYFDLSMQASEYLKISMNQTKNYASANLYNRAFSASYVFADGVSMISSAHPTPSGNQSNKLSSAADLSEKALEDLCVQIYTSVTNKGFKIKLKPVTLHIHPSERFNAIRILESQLKNNTAENALNAMKYDNTFSGGVKENVFFASTSSWFVRTNCPNSMIGLNRTPLEITKDNEFTTDNKQIKSYARYSVIPNDFRGIFGSE